MSKNDLQSTLFLRKDLKLFDRVAKKIDPFPPFDQHHPFFWQKDWFDYALLSDLTKEQITSYALLSAIFPLDPLVSNIEIVDLDSARGKELFSLMCRGSLKNEGYEELLKLPSPVERLIFKISFHQKSTMKPFNDFVLRGACYDHESIIHLMPLSMHKLLQCQFFDNVQEISSCFGYSTHFQDWCFDVRPLSIPNSRFFIPSAVHGQKAIHPLEIMLHDTAHLILSSHIPKEDRLLFQQMGRSIYQQGEKKLAIYLVDMPFISYLDLPKEKAFCTSLSIAIYRSASKNWDNRFITQIINGHISDELKKQLDGKRWSLLKCIVEKELKKLELSSSELLLF